MTETAKKVIDFIEETDLERKALNAAHNVQSFKQLYDRGRSFGIYAREYIIDEIDNELNIDIDNLERNSRSEIYKYIYDMNLQAEGDRDFSQS